MPSSLSTSESYFLIFSSDCTFTTPKVPRLCVGDLESWLLNLIISSVGGNNFKVNHYIAESGGCECLEPAHV